MWSTWKQFKLLPWQYGLTDEPVWEHLKAISSIDFMMHDADRMEEETKPDR